ncbi:MAG: 3'-5' exonuclease, partial [Solirubrobacteraceae bacterium]|nr:3'-5' exonuclease [Solirubrobacteraceae bacterium]
GPMWIPVGGDGRPAVTVVGDPRQAIYGFRHADVGLIKGAGERIGDEGAMQLSTNYRSDAEVLTAIDEAFATLDPEHQPVTAARGPERLPSGEARVELLITKEEPGSKDAPLPSWAEIDLGGTVGEKTGPALAEARLIAARIRELREAEPEGSITVLGRARSVLAPVAEALGDLGIPASIDGAEGFWERLEVIDVLAWLRLVRNLADDAALVTVCASPLVGLSADGLTQLGLLEADRHSGGRVDALREAVDRFSEDDAARLRGLFALVDRQRQPGRAADPAGLIDELLLATGYDEHLLRLVGGDRRAANVVRLRRLAGELAARGGDLTDLVERAEKEVGHELRAPEASVAGSGAVILMTVHQSKGLEFDTVVVAGLGSRQRLSSPALIGGSKPGDRRLGLRLRPSPGAPAQSLFAHDELVTELRDREDEELRRVLYVALTRARERLIVSGIARWTQKGSPFTSQPSTSAPVLTWLAPAMVPEIESVIGAASSAQLRTSGGIALRVSTPDGEILPVGLRAPERPELPVHVGDGPRVDLLPPAGADRLQAPRVLSYTALKSHARCGLRFYAERVLGLRDPDDPVTVNQTAGPIEAAWPDPVDQAAPTDPLTGAVDPVLAQESASP